MSYPRETNRPANQKADGSKECLPKKQANPGDTWDESGRNQPSSFHGYLLVSEKRVPENPEKTEP
jgi:hypothetical protein